MKAHEVPVLLHGEGTSAWPALLLAGRLGLSTRIGLEDVLVLPDGAQAADNARWPGQPTTSWPTRRSVSGSMTGTVAGEGSPGIGAPGRW